MASFVMVCQGRAHDGSGPVGQYLEIYQPQAFDGRGAMRWTPDLDKAKRFPTVEALLTEWKLVPTNHPIRLSDGQPNRPLTAFTVSTLRVD